MKRELWSLSSLRVWLCVSSLVCGVCPMSLVWLELLELMKGRSGVALTQLGISSSRKG
jgi:hypothetical protein